MHTYIHAKAKVVVAFADNGVIDPDFRDERSSLRRKTNRIWIRHTSCGVNVCMETLSASDKDDWLEKLAAWCLPSLQVNTEYVFLHYNCTHVCMYVCVYEYINFLGATLQCSSAKCIVRA